VSSHKIYHTGFGESSFKIRCNNDDAFALAEFLFVDFPGAPDDPLFTKKYDIIFSEAEPELSLSDNGKQLYCGSSRYQLAYTLMNEVIFCCIDHNTSHHAIHAGAVYKDNRCILLPGQSGNGKSTLTSWLIMNGFQYLTDELVFLTHDAQVLPLTRPISLKIAPSHESWLVAEEQSNKIITSDEGSMIPHRLLNPSFFPRHPRLTEVIFPSYSPGAEGILQEISPAKSSLYLLKSHVNARNLQGHGVAQLASIVKNCNSYTLTYSSFSDLQTIFREFTGSIAS